MYSSVSLRSGLVNIFIGIPISIISPRHKRGIVRHPCRLPYVVGDDGDGVIIFKSEIKSSIEPVEIGSSAEVGSSSSNTSGRVVTPRADTDAAADHPTMTDPML